MLGPQELKGMIRDIPDFPKKGVLFKDITTLLSNGQAFATAIDLIGDHYIDQKVDLIVAAEARGFVFGAPLAYKAQLRRHPHPKRGKTPPIGPSRPSTNWSTGRTSWRSTRTLCGRGTGSWWWMISWRPGGPRWRPLSWWRKLQGVVIGLAFLIELTFLKGRERLKNHEVFSLIEF